MVAGCPVAVLASAAVELESVGESLVVSGQLLTADSVVVYSLVVVLVSVGMQAFVAGWKSELWKTPCPAHV